MNYEALGLCTCTVGGHGLHFAGVVAVGPQLHVMLGHLGMGRLALGLPSGHHGRPVRSEEKNGGI